jgi:hypothetical protein
MTYWVKRVILKGGELVTERELRPEENRFDGPAPVVGDTFTVTVRGRTFTAEVVWGNWPGRADDLDPQVVVPLRVKEL